LKYLKVHEDKNVHLFDFEGGFLIFDSDVITIYTENPSKATKSLELPRDFSNV
jgi:hypothetical protein